MTIQQAASSLHKSLQGRPGFFSVGVADKGQFNPEAHLVIYHRHEYQEEYPASYEGFPVHRTAIGGEFMTLEAPRTE